MDGRTVLNFIVSGADGFAVARVRRSELRLETASQFQSKLISQYLHDAIIETVITEALKIDKKLPDPLFNPWKDAKMKYRFVTIWYIEAPIESVCEAIYHSLNWPQWWRNVESVEELALGDSRGIGSVRRYTWKGRLPYRLTFDVCIIHSEPLAAIEGVASGDVEGNGRWSFTADGAVTAALCEWQVRTTPVWMNLLALFARPFFKWNHNAVMQQGGEELARMLNARLVEIAHY